MLEFIKQIFSDDQGRASAKRICAIALIVPFVAAVFADSVNDSKLYTIAALISALLISSSIEKFNNKNNV
jgi:hypothetical protein